MGMMTGQYVDGAGKIAEVPLKLGADGGVLSRTVGGERNAASADNNYDATKHEATSYLLKNVATAQNIGAAGTTPIFLMGIQIRTALTGTLTIVGFTDPLGAAKSWVLPIGTVGAVLPPGNARRLETGCTMTLSVAADGDFVVVDWRPIA